MRSNVHGVSLIPEVVDLFCGIGGLSYGLKSQGFVIKGGFDLDATCKYAFEHNIGAPFFHKNIKDVSGDEIRALYSNGSIRVLAGCAPCQPFSSYSHKKDKDPIKYDLLYEFGRLVKEVSPDYVTMENVSQITNFKLKPVFSDFLNTLTGEGYHVFWKVVFCPDYGIPQTRKRLVLLASKDSDIELLQATHTKNTYLSVGDVIKDLPAIHSGESYIQDPLHRANALSPLNLERIKATPYGGSWRDWPDKLVLTCHKTENGKSFGSVYGRMRWEDPAPTMTTECTGYGNGRFGHPEQDRAITPREAARFQTFPDTYKFFEDETKVSITKAARYIGNAVPPKLGEVIARSLNQNIKASKNA
ncbi:DNA (cytosine-5-)-methyltransferase [uncultured Alistipes sp.]|uniref:DNA cytosine methyltransferase n=1 Tax=uncultured Alistipes sp. TaxID=538949 RepID=UPI0025FAF88E|nr:DNA (cytosine-5-)-methyltransferase [uncultured Alistipes sp.]